jgi:Kef-type K+ transport system membrane component KefB
MINVYMFLATVFLLTFLIGILLKRIKIPWIFGALLVGSLLAIYNPFEAITSSPSFEFLAQLGMYLLLFIIGFEIDLKMLKKNKRFIFSATFFTILFATVFGTLLIYFFLEYSLFISVLVALSFATVGEAILVPILDEFKIINTKLGQSIIGIGTLDDIVEILLLIVVSVLIGTNIHPVFNIFLIFISLGVLGVLILGLAKLKKSKFRLLSIDSLFLITLLILFLFIGIGNLVHAAPIAALFAGVGVNKFIPDDKSDKVKLVVRALCYGFFAPIFFLWVGVTMDMHYLVAYPLLIFLVILVSVGAKLLGSWVAGRKELGTKQSILLGIGLSVRFSTSIIIIKILFDNGLIGADLFSIIVASSIIFNFIVPVLFSRLLVRWKVSREVAK